MRLRGGSAGRKATAPAVPNRFRVVGHRAHRKSAVSSPPAILVKYSSDVDEGAEEDDIVIEDESQGEGSEDNPLSHGTRVSGGAASSDRNVSERTRSSAHSGSSSGESDDDDEDDGEEEVEEESSEEDGTEPSGLDGPQQQAKEEGKERRRKEREEKRAAAKALAKSRKRKRQQHRQATKNLILEGKRERKQSQWYTGPLYRKWDGNKRPIDEPQLTPKAPMNPHKVVYNPVLPSGPPWPKRRRTCLEVVRAELPTGFSISRLPQLLRPKGSAGQGEGGADPSRPYFLKFKPWAEVMAEEQERKDEMARQAQCAADQAATQAAEEWTPAPHLVAIVRRLVQSITGKSMSDKRTRVLADTLLDGYRGWRAEQYGPPAASSSHACAASAATTSAAAAAAAAAKTTLAIKPEPKALWGGPLGLPVGAAVQAVAVAAAAAGDGAASALQSSKMPLQLPRQQQHPLAMGVGFRPLNNSRQLLRTKVVAPRLASIHKPRFVQE